MRLASCVIAAIARIATLRRGLRRDPYADLIDPRRTEGFQVQRRGCVASQFLCYALNPRARVKRTLLAVWDTLKSALR